MSTKLFDDDHGDCACGCGDLRDRDATIATLTAKLEAAEAQRDGLQVIVDRFTADQDARLRGMGLPDAWIGGSNE